MKTLIRIITFGVAIAAAQADPPPGYYAAAEGKTGIELREALHGIIRNHYVIPYASDSRFDTADALQILDAFPLDTNYVVEIYSGSNALASSFPTNWNREHQWPNSYGLNAIEPAFSDLFNLREIGRASCRERV